MSAGRGRGLVVPSWLGAPMIDPATGLPMAVPTVGALPMVPPPILASVAGTAAAALPLAPGAFQPPMGVSPFVGGVPFMRPPGLVAPAMPKPPTAPIPPSLHDPTNDATCWSEHLTEDGKKYWYNMKTQVSTFDKPLVLKTPEERAIPPCAWKEYNANGQTYYSNGKDSVWTMPEEYRIWKEKVDAVEKKLEEKKKATVAGLPASAALSSSVSSSSLSTLQNAGNVVGLQTPSTSTNTTNNTTTSSNTVSIPIASTPNISDSNVSDNTDNGGQHNNNNVNARSNGNNNNGKKNSVSQQIIPKYATPAEAMEAFKELLTQKHISTTAKIKEVQDICQSDPRWDALTTMGEKRQALAEYQTKKLKLEKEQQKQKQRKHKDSFLLMLAENTTIDVKTRWKDAMELLKDDIRYKNIEEAYEREELFNDFIKELEKKEREDRIKRKEHALTVVRDHMKTMNKDGFITLRTSWADIREQILTLISRSDLRCLEEGDCRRSFQDFSRDLMEDFKKNEQKRKEEYQKSIQTKLNDFKSLLYDCVKDGDIIAFTRWKEVIEMSRIISSPVYQALYSLLVTDNPSAGVSSSTSAVPSSNNKELEKLQGEFEFMLRQQFDEVITKVQDVYKLDKKLIKRFLHDINYEVAHDTKYEDWKMMMLRFLNMKEDKHPTVPNKVVYVHYTAASSATTAADAEEGEELEEGEEGEERAPVPKTVNGSSSSSAVAASSSGAAPSSSSGADADVNTAATIEQLQEMLLQRPYNFKEIFQDLHDKAYDEWEEEQRQKKKNEEKFLNLLKEYFYLSDHVNMSWDDAKAMISNRSAYDLLHKSEKKRIFYDYMAQLKEKMEQKAMAMRALSEGAVQELEPGEYATSSNNYHNKKRERDHRDRDRDHHRDRSSSFDYRDSKKR